MPPLTAAEIDRDYVTDGVPSSGPHQVRKSDRRAWGTWVETFISSFTSNGGLIYSSKALLDADLAKDANRMAWVLGDPVAGNNGVYRKIGASGTGSWTRASDLPFSFIVASDAGAGTPNAIQATTTMPVSGSALVLLNIFEENTASPVTVSFNGETALTVKSNSGNDIVAGGLQSGMLVMGRVSGSTFRLVTDQVSAAIVAAAEAAQVAAGLEADRAEAAAASLNLPLTLTPMTIPVTDEAATARVDRSLESVRQMLGLGDFASTFLDDAPSFDPTGTGTRVLINGATENGGSPVYHRHFGTIERDNVGRIHLFYRRALGHATYFEGGIHGVTLEHNGQQRSSEFAVVPARPGYDIADPRLTLLPNGEMLLVWQELPLTSAGVVGTPIVFKAKRSSDNGTTWGDEYNIFSCEFSYCRLFGDLKIISDYGSGGRWRIALTAYYRVSLSPSVLHTAIFYSEDAGMSFIEGTPIYSGSLQYNETAVAFVGAYAGIAVMRVNPADGFYISRTLDGGTTWSAPAKLTAIETQAVAPTLDIVTKDGVQYVLLGYCDRAADATKWRWDNVRKVLTSNSAFSSNSKIASSSDMIEASGYQTTKLFASGQMLSVEFKEYPYNTTIADPVGTDVRLVSQNIEALVGGEEVFTPIVSGGTNPGAPTGSFTGTMRKEPNGLVHGVLRVSLTNKGGMTGQVKISLPFANRSGTRYRSGGAITFFSGANLPSYGQPYAFIASGSSTIDLWRSTVTSTSTTGLANLDSADITDTFTVEIAFFYFAAD